VRRQITQTFIVTLPQLFFTERYTLFSFEFLLFKDN